MPVRILLCDDHEMVRRGIREVLDTQDDLEVVGVSADAGGTLELVREHRPDVLILDIRLQEGSGLDLLDEAHRIHPDLAVLVLTMHDDVSFLRAALAAGALGFVNKRSGVEELRAAVRSVARGRAHVDLTFDEDQVWESLEIAGVDGESGEAGIEGLSPREREVLGLVAEGYTSREVAERLFISPKTVDTYRSRLMRRLGLKNRSDLVRLALEAGFLAPGREAEETARD
ncbi:MAG: response regulator transcription factor [bacterium]